MAKVSSSDISVVGFGYFQPIADLTGKLFECTEASARESGYVSSVIVLSVLAIESLVARDRYFLKNKQLAHRTAPPEYMKEIYAYDGYERLSETFAVRDAIVHNHMWTLSYAVDESDYVSQGDLTHAIRQEWSGNHRLKASLDASGKRTKLLGLNVIPGKMNRQDVLIVLEVFINVLRFFEAMETKKKRELGKLKFLRRIVLCGKSVKVESLPGILRTFTPKPSAQ